MQKMVSPRERSCILCVHYDGAHLKVQVPPLSPARPPLRARARAACAQLLTSHVCDVSPRASLPRGARAVAERAPRLCGSCREDTASTGHGGGGRPGQQATSRSARHIWARWGRVTRTTVDTIADSEAYALSATPGGGAPARPFATSVRTLGTRG